MLITSNDPILIRGVPHKKHMLLADANIPYKFSVDKKRNTLFFCINADEFSDQSFQSVLLQLDTGFASVIPGIRNGFASAVDQVTGDVYLGGSNGIFKYNYGTRNIVVPPLVNGIDIFDMYFFEDLYFVDTANQNLYIYKNNDKKLVPKLEDRVVQHFVIDADHDLYFVNSDGLFVLVKGNKLPILLDDSGINIRGATTDVYGAPYFIAHDGIYSFEKGRKQLVKILHLTNGYALAFDKDNNIILSDERTVVMLTPC